MSALGDRRCPTCGSEIGNRAICARCGTLVGIEFRLAQIQIKTRSFFEDRIAAVSRGLRPHHFFWACALMPVVLLPPIVALVYAVSSMRRNGGQRAGFEWLAIAAAINIVVSALILYKFHFSPGEVAAVVGAYLRAILRSLLPFVPSPSGAPKLTPV